jgi:regulation of enolase protein 1 (concanavalin A-like superfamily)
MFALLGRAEAATRTVCASGCQYTSVQRAIDEAAPGDVIVLRAGQTFTGNITLRAKSSSSTAYITIKSDAPASSLPADGVRLVPPGKPGATAASGALARLVGHGGSWKSTAVIRTETGAHHYRLQFLHVDGIANLGYGTLVSLDNSQTSNAAAPHSIVLDRVYLNGHPTKGMKRGVAVNGRNLDIINSYISGFMSTADAQAIAGWNGAGPIRIINNFLEATGENIMFGGADPKISNLVPSDIEIRGNHMYKRPAWRNAVLNTPSRPSVSARTGGSLPAGTHYFKVVAVLPIDGDSIVSAPSAEASVTVGSSGAVSLSWSGVSGAERYRIYRGTSSNGQNVYVETTSASTSMIYTGSGQSSGAPRTSGTRWTAKNLLELKNAQRVTINGNLLENNWAGFQFGYAVLFTPKNQNGTAPWTAVRDITFTNNIVRHVAGGLSISGRDYQRTSEQARNITIANNLFQDVSSAYGSGMGGFLLLAGGPANLTVNHNTILHTRNIVDVDRDTISGFVYTNNLSRHNTYGIKGDGRAVGTDTLQTVFPGYVFRGNALAGGPAGSYPAGNFFPSVTEFNTSFVNPSAGNYGLVSASSLNNAGTDGRDVGADLAAIAAAQGGGAVPHEPGDPTDPPPDEGGDPGPPAGFPQDWMSQDIGNAGVQGAAAFNGTTFTLRGAGNDIWGTADAFHFAYTTLSGDGSIVARVASVSGSDAWTKVGVMMRGSTSAGSAHAGMFVSKGKGLAFQRRTRDGGVSTHTSGGSGTAPRWVKLVRAGNVVTASVSTNGSTWTVVGSDTITMPASVLVGLAVSSHNSGALATGLFDNVRVTEGAALPSGWESDDVGNVSRAGSVSASGGTYTVRGAGADVWGSADAFHFASQTLAGDGEIVARVASIAGTNAWTKVGVMIRQSLDAGSAHAFMIVSRGKGLAFQRRTVTGGTSTHTSGGSGTAPRWVKLARQGDVITASVSTNGTTWTVVGRDTFSISGAAHVGLAVSSHVTGELATGTFDNVTITPR